MKQHMRMAAWRSTGRSRRLGAGEEDSEDGGGARSGWAA